MPIPDNEVNIFEEDKMQNTAISKARFSKYRLSNPGFFATFENQAEVYEMLVHDEIQQVLYWICKDTSFVDERDTKYNERDICMKKPYLVSGYEADNAADNKLFSKLFALGDQSVEDTSGGLDLLTLKQVVRDSYHMCNFAAQEIMWESAQAERRS